MAEDDIGYLTALLNRTLHVHASDGRIFVGQLKCTDRERNIVLAMTQEFRQPTATDLELPLSHRSTGFVNEAARPGMRKRFVGLIVVPGQYITKIELEE